MKNAKHIPKFRSEEEEAKFWKTHSVTEFHNDLKEVQHIKFPKPRKRLISVRMDTGMVESLKKIAATKGIGYLTLIRLWIAEKLFKEHRPLHTSHS